MASITGALAQIPTITGALAEVQAVTGELAQIQTIAGELGLPFGVVRAHLIDSNGDYIIDSDGQQIATKEYIRE